MAAAASASSSLMRPLGSQRHGRAAALPTASKPTADIFSFSSSCRRRCPAAVLVVATRAAPKKTSGGGGGGFGPKKTLTTSGGGGTKQQQQQQQTQAPDASAPCPCASGRAYGACCGPAHAGKAPPASPELLLRSRFAAYRLGLVDYLVSTTHPAAPERRSAALGLAGLDGDGKAAGQGGEGGEGAAAASSSSSSSSADAYRASIARTARATEFVALSIDRAGASVRPVEGALHGEEEAFLSFTVWHRPKAGGARRGGGGAGATGNESVARETSHFVKGPPPGGGIGGGGAARWLYLGEARETGGEEGARRAKEAEAGAAAAA